MGKKLEHYTATWCGPCKAMKPVIEQYLSEHPEIEYEAIDINEQEERSRAAGVQGVPTFVATNIDKNGKGCRSTATGAMPPAKLDLLFNCPN